MAALALGARGRGGEPARRRGGKPPGVWRAPQETRPLGAESHCLQPGLPVALGLCRKRGIGRQGSAPARLAIPSRLWFIELDHASC